jgi:hypothetical protein
VRLEIRRRADEGNAHVLADADGDHVALDELANLDACVVFAGDEVECG